MIFTTAQVAAIIGLLMAFGVDPATITKVQNDLTPTATPVVQAPVEQTQSTSTPTFGSVAPTVPSCDTTPLIFITTNPSVYDSVNNPDEVFTITTDVKDACGTEYPYSLTTGNTERFSIAGWANRQPHYIVTGGNIGYWEAQAHPEVPAGNVSFPITVTTETASSTSYITVQ